MERIINFFQTEDMQNRLVNVILNDGGLQEDLNLDTPDNANYNSSKGLNYLAVTKVGILTFADYIHDIYIADGGWREDTWNWIFDPGYTLVDLVDAALGAIGDAVNAVKTAAEDFVNGVKNGLSFIADAVLSVIYNGIASASNLLIEGLFRSFSELLPILEFDGTQNIPKISLDTKEFRFGFEGFNSGLDMIVNSETLKVFDLFFNPKVETLGLFNDVFGLSGQQLDLLEKLALTELLIFPFLLISRIFFQSFDPKAHLLATGIIVSSHLLQGVGEFMIVNNEKSSFADNKDFLEVIELLSMFHLGMGIGMISWFHKGHIIDENVLSGANIGLSRGSNSNIIALILSALGLSYGLFGESAVQGSLFGSTELNAKPNTVLSVFGLGILIGFMKVILLAKFTITENQSQNVVKARDSITYGSGRGFQKEMAKELFFRNLDKVFDLEEKIISSIKMMIAYHVAYSIFMGFYWNFAL